MKGHFTKLVKAGDRLREFNFRKLPSQLGNLFHVDVSDERGGRHIFKMHKEEENQWRIDDQNLPKWIYDAQDKLVEAINNQ